MAHELILAAAALSTLLIMGVTLYCTRLQASLLESREGV